MGQGAGLLLTIIIFCGILAGVMPFFAMITSNYAVTAPSNNMASFNSTYKSIENLANSMSVKMQENPENIEVLGSLYVISAGATNAIMLLMGSVGILQNILMNFMFYSLLPSPFPQIILAAVSLFIVFIVLKSILKWDV